MITKDEAFQEYEEELARISKEFNEAMETARTTLREQLKSLQVEHHKELKAIRDLEQKTKRSKQNVK